MKYFTIGIALLTLMVCCTNGPKPNLSNFFSDFIRKKLIRAEPDKYSYHLHRQKMANGKIQVEAEYLDPVSGGRNHVNFTFDKTGKLECLTPVSDKPLYGKLEDMAKQFYELNVVSFTKEPSGNTTYFFATNARPRFMEIRDMDAYRNGIQPDSHNAKSGYNYYSYPNPSQLSHYMGNFYIERTADPYWGGTW